jgi:itaconate CoA-transferase
LSTDVDMRLLRALLGSADVFVSNMAPGALGRLGLDTASLADMHPDLIVVEVTGYGAGGPLERKRAYDLLVQAEAGSCSITGWPGHPAKPGIPIADVGTALYSYSSILAALFARERTGRGAIIHVAMLDVVAEMMGFALNQVIHGAPEPQPVGMGSPMVAPYGAYLTSDGHTVILGTTSDREWRRLAEGMLGDESLAGDQRYKSNAQRCDAREELDLVIAKWCSDRTLQEIQELADEAGIGNAVLNSVGDLARHPQLSERGRWIEVESEVGLVPALVHPALAADWQVDRAPIPFLGEHTDAVRLEFIDHVHP